MAKRVFRTADSLAAEERTRAILPAFLASRGFTDVKDQRSGKRQAIGAVSPAGDRLSISVRLCWRRQENSRDSKRVQTYSAAQLLADVKGDWEGSLSRKIASEQARGITHVLFVQPEDNKIRYAALVPLSKVIPIWTAQRDISLRIIKEGRAGRRKKNHAMNGSSPTIWLQDDRGGQEVAAALWNHQGVVDVVNISAHYVSADEANQTLDTEKVESDFQPCGNDRRRHVFRQIKERRGQQSFRDTLRVRYGNRCVVTGCSLLDVLEAAHISPYRGVEDNHPRNGLLLRADIHTLFDLNLLGIEPESLVIRLHPDVIADTAYASLDGTKLICEQLHRPSEKALRDRFELFQQRLNAVVFISPVQSK
ncbi:MAG: HNH endonuclease [Planctomycetes bacterium]|nr:HNH endonuclease [Planctomycetota bacterium]